MILLQILNILSSYREFYEDIQDTIIRKYKKKEFEVINLKENALLINVNFYGENSNLGLRFIGAEEPIIKNLYVKFRLNIMNRLLITYRGKNSTQYFKEFLDDTFKDDVIDFEIIYSLSAYSFTNLQKKYIDTFIEDVKDYHKNHRMRILRNASILMRSLENPLFSSQINCLSDDIVINFIFVRNRFLHFFSINFKEFRFKKYFIEILRDYEFSNLSDENLLERLFENFKFSFYSANYDNTEIYDKFIYETSKNISWYEKTPHVFYNKFPYRIGKSSLSINGKEYDMFSHFKRNISKKIFDDIKQFFVFSLSLKNDDLLAVGLLYYSLSDDMKILIINKIMESYYSSYSLILFHICRSIGILSKEKFQIIMNLNFSLRSLDKDQYKKKALEIKYKNIFERYIKKIILDLRPRPKNPGVNYLMILFGKVLDEIYLSDEYDTEKYHWKGLYDEILEKLHLPKNQNSAFNIFKYVLLDLENVLYVLQYEQTAISDILAYITNRPLLALSNHDFYFRLIEYKNMLQKENLNKFPIKDALQRIIK
jgi:hypothetical protein